MDQSQTTPRSRTGASFVAAWLGWAFDGLDGFLYVLVAAPFVAELLGEGATLESIAVKAALIQGFFLIGWALGGGVFGWVGDRIGRSKVLVLTILTYAMFTGLSAFAQEWWHLLIFRFVAALGIGGEWAAGSALVSETLPKKHRAWASATLQSGYMVGILLAAFAVGFIPEPRYVFLVGVLPALATLWIRKAVPEPEEWKVARAKQERARFGELFKGKVLKSTLLATSMTSICLTAIWIFLYFQNHVLRGLPELQGLDKSTIASAVMSVTIVFTLWNIVGNYGATYLAKWLGYRKAFAIYLLLSLITFMVGFSQPPTNLIQVYVLFSITMFFAAGVFAIFPLYIPLLFPTLLRTTGAGLSYNTGRIFSAIGTFAGGAIVAAVGSPSKAIWYAGLLFIPGIILALFMPEPDREEANLALQ